MTNTYAAARQIEQARYWRLAALSAALWLPYGLHLPYFPVWLSARGLSDFQIAATLATPLILRVLLMPLIAHAADHRGIAATLAFCACTMAAGYLCLGFADGFVPIFIGSLITIVAQGSMPALADALALADIRRMQKAGLRLLQFGRIRVGASISTLVMMLLSGLIAAGFPGGKLIFALALLAVVPAAATLAMARRAGRLRLHREAATGLTENPRALSLAIVVILASAMVQGSHAEIYAFGTLQWKLNGFGGLVISLAWALGVSAECLLLIFAGRHVQNVRNALRLLMLGAAGGVLRWFAMSFNPPAALVLPLQTLHALSFAATYMGSVLVLGWLAGPHHRARIQGWSSTAMALTMALSTMACGRLTQLYGARAYLAMAALAATGFCLTFAAMRLRRRLALSI
jgi:PPP family 3-phenylpropionic acid transporter